MTKAEFLELRAGEQRWVLLQCLRFALAMLLNEKPSLTRAVLAQFDGAMDVAEEETVEGEL
jgi:hypothetical protein